METSTKDKADGRQVSSRVRRQPLWDMALLGPDLPIGHPSDPLKGDFGVPINLSANRL